MNLIIMRIMEVRKKKDISHFVTSSSRYSEFDTENMQLVTTLVSLGLALFRTLGSCEC